MRDIHRKTPVLESLFSKATGLRNPTKLFPCEYCKIFKNSFFYRTPPLAAFDNSNQSKIFWEITASKFQRQHATQFNRYEGLFLATKAEICCEFSNGICKIFEQLVSRIFLDGYFWKENRAGEGHAVTLVVSGFHTVIYLLCHETMCFY